VLVDTEIEIDAGTETDAETETDAGTPFARRFARNKERA
jgi:hypothetical protein